MSASEGETTCRDLPMRGGSRRQGEEPRACGANTAPWRFRALDAKTKNYSRRGTMSGMDGNYVKPSIATIRR